MATERRRPEPRLKTIQQKTAFLRAYEVTADVAQATAAAKVRRKAHYEWMKSDEVYCRDFKKAFEKIGDALECEAVRRAVEGVQKALFYRGRPIKTGGKRGRQIYETTYSDTLLITLLRRFKPDQYRERTVTEVTGSIDLVERLQAGRQRLLEMRSKEGAIG